MACIEPARRAEPLLHLPPCLHQLEKEARMAEEMNPLEELFVDELKDIYSAENQIIKALPKMAKAASSPELKRAFERHLEETRRQVERLDQIGQELDTKLTGKKCHGMEGLIE